MITVNDTVLDDNQLIFVAKISLTSSYLYLCNRPNGITLSSHDYSGQLVIKDSMTPVVKNTNIIYGGGIGNVASFSVQINNYTGYPTAGINPLKYYPETAIYLSGREVEVGFVWEGATTEAEITTIFKGFIEQSPTTPGIMDIVAIEISELELIQLPYYSVQKDFDNGISYFPNAPKESIGMTIPILYGDAFNGVSATGTPDVSPYAPGVLVEQNNYKYIIASHYTDASTAEQYIRDYDISAIIAAYDSGGSSVSLSQRDKGSSRFNIFHYGVGDIDGSLNYYPKKTGTHSEVTDFIFSTDGLTDYTLIPSKTISFIADLTSDSIDLGGFSSMTSIMLKVTVSSPTTGQQIRIRTYDHSTEGFIDEHIFNLVIEGQTLTIDYGALFTLTNWDWKKLISLEYEIKNIAATQNVSINDIVIWVQRYRVQGLYKAKYYEQRGFPLYFLGIPIAEEGRYIKHYRDVAVDKFDYNLQFALTGRQF